MAESQVTKTIDQINQVNQWIEQARSSYKQKHYQKAVTLVSKSIDRICDISNHPELIPDSVDQVYRLAKGFQALNIPMLSGDYIVYSACAHPFPNTLNYASIFRYIFETEKNFVDYAHQLLRILNKKAAQ